MLVAVAFCPAPPLLVPELAAGAAGELAGLLQACDQAVTALLDAHPDEVVVLGPGATTGEHAAGAAGSLRGFGVDVTTGDGDPVLPTALTVGGWLLDRACGGARGMSEGQPERVMVEVAATASADQTAALGQRIAGRPLRTALLVMGDGAAGRTPKAPGTFDPRGQDWDDAVAAALASADVAALAAIDADLARELGAAGPPAWSTAAAAVRAPGGLPSPRPDLLAYQAPYGVGYFVATWLPS